MNKRRRRIAKKRRRLARWRIRQADRLRPFFVPGIIDQIEYSLTSISP